MVGGQVQIANDLISVLIVGGSEAHRGKIFGLDENDSVFIRDGNVHLGDTLSILSVDRWSVSLPKLKGEVLKGMFTKVLSLDGLS